MSILRLGGSMDSLATLNEDQQIAYLKALSYLSKVDGQVDEAEQEFLKDMAVLHGISNDRLKDIMNEEDIEDVIHSVQKITNRRACLELVKDMCVLAHSDDELSDEEVLFIGRVGQAMGVSLDKIEQISKWIIDRIIWLEEAKIIFEEV